MKLSGSARMLVFIAALGLAFGAQAAGAAGRPHILLILADDMGYSDVSPYGSEIFTPNIARLAAQGMMLSNFHVAAYCAPTRGMHGRIADREIQYGPSLERADRLRGRRRCGTLSW